MQHFAHGNLPDAATAARRIHHSRNCAISVQTQCDRHGGKSSHVRNKTGKHGQVRRCTKNTHVISLTLTQRIPISTLLYRFHPGTALRS